MYNWDYDLPKNWQPKTDRQWLWFLERKINYDDWQGLKKKTIKKYFPRLKKRLDPGKRELLKHYLARYA
jgi:MarR-like DNA-binding transcriptional regulator SgrR of sgrS sRNA